MVDTLVELLGFSAEDPAFWMPLVFMGLLFSIVAAGVVLDGFDIGVGCLTLVAPKTLRPRMVSLLGPWRDANEFWLLLGLGVFAAAFPNGWGVIMGQLYVPLSLLSLGVMLRAVSFEFRLRAPLELQGRWILGFGLGSLATAVAHGLLLGNLVVAYRSGQGYMWFSMLLALCCVAAYCLLGATWLIMREPGELRVRAIFWGRRTVRWAAAGAVGVSVVLAFANTGVFLKWSDGPQWSAIAMLWGGLLACFIVVELSLQRMVTHSDGTTMVPFLATLLAYLAILGGLFYSFFPYLVLDNITIWDGASSVGSLRLVLAAAVIAMPVALIFNIWVYWRMFGLSKPSVPPGLKQAPKPAEASR
ncbi:cytochrome d ubiquinol oxidase subunit II [Pusillimonas sp.]|uniref:cytochrome d ubiquinol oxidase subunit II n=1 Tax=Pusillimonas sp. TaxID=3040095 RepID=UPI0039C9BBA6